MPKKPARNAFYFFMKDIEPSLRKEGRVFLNGIQDIVPIAHPRWKALPEEEKQRYERMAKEYKAKMRGSEGDKYRMDNTCKLLSERVDVEAETEKKRQRERQSVREKWPPGKDIMNEVFYFINFQTMCKTDEGEYLPAEIAVIEYSIRKGVGRILHRFIEPGKIPMGYKSDCFAKCEDYHQIPLNFPLADANYRGLWIQLENFVNPNGEKPEYPPLYCMGRDIEETAYCLQWIHDRTCLGIPNRLRKIYELEGMVTDIYAHIGKPVAKSRIIDMLTTNAWDYDSKTRCDYHEEKECKYCSLGIVRRYSFAISDSLCGILGVEITRQHLPVRTDNPVTALPPTSMKVKVNGHSDFRGRKGGNKFFTARPPRMTSQSNNYSALAAKSNKAESSDESSDEETSYTSLRRPNIPVNFGSEPPDIWKEPAQSNPSTALGRGTFSGVPIPTTAPPPRPTQAEFPSLGCGLTSMPGGPSVLGFKPAQNDFPGLGRGISLQGVGIGRGVPLNHAQPDAGPKFAGRALAPDPSSAPIPPAAWVNVGPKKPSMESISKSLEESSISEASSKSLPQGFQSEEPSVKPKQPPLSNGMSKTQVPDFVGKGRGILASVDPAKKLPKGRGYAPPGMDVAQHLQLLRMDS